MAIIDSAQFEALVVHHRECELLAQRMADLLRDLRDDSQLRHSIEQVLTEWNAHQWPTDESEA